MKNKLVIILIIIMVLITSFLVIKKVDSASSSKELELTYSQNAGIPYKWEYEIEDESIVKFVKSYVIEDENKNGKVGARVSTNYVFKGLKKGTTTITFKFVNFTNNEVSKEEKHKVKVDSNGNISLVAIQ